MNRRSRTSPQRPTPERPTDPRSTDPRSTDRGPPFLPRGGVLALIVLAPLIPTEGAGQGTTAVLSLLWMLAALVACGFTWRGRKPIAWDAADGLGLALAAWIGLAMFATGWRANPRLMLHSGWHWLGLLAAAGLARRVIATDRDRRAVVVILCAITTGLAAHGICQYSVIQPRNRTDYAAASEPERQRLLVASGVDPAPDSADRFLFENRLRSLEPFATFALPNSLAGLLSAWLVVAITVGWNRRTSEEGTSETPRGSARFRWRAFWFAACFLIAACLILTKSRSAWIACVVGLGWSIARSTRRGGRRWPMVAVCAAMIVLFVVGGFGLGVLDRQVFTEGVLSMTYRCQYWRGAVGMVVDHPVWGVGPGAFQDAYAAYKKPEASEMVADPHNFAFEVAATFGIPGLALLLACLAAACVVARRAARSQASTLERSHARGNRAGDAAWLWGAAAAFPLADGYGRLIDFPPEPFPGIPIPVLWCVVLPISGLVYAAGRPWIERGNWDPAVAAIGWLVLAVHLLAAGGISFGGVAQSFWLLLALLVGPPHSSRSDRAPARWIAVRPPSASIGLAASLVVFAACVFTEYLPTVRGGGLLRQAESARDRETARALLNAAAAADRWNPEPWRLAATMELDAWVRTHDAARREAWIGALAEMVRRDPVSHAASRLEGDIRLTAYRAMGRSEDLDGALDALERTVRLYPNHNHSHAQLAWVAHLAGRADSARFHAETALQLDARNPHWEQKLARRAVRDPGRSDRWESQVAGPPPGTDAEQLMRQLRS
ncbi:MAG: O-antigen ligase family protein [Planctomycetes bacterium]|nr:O-antigen ligase family protein [Planctomycetota bacterium]